MTTEKLAYTAALATQPSRMTVSERRLRALQRDLLAIPLRKAKLRAEILTLELGGTAPVATEAWRVVRERETAYREAVDRAGLGSTA